MKIVFPAIKDSASEPLAFDGSFSIDLAGELKFRDVKIALDSEKTFDTTCFPGFNQIVIERLETDIETYLSMDFRLKPTDNAKDALSFLSGDKPITGSFYFNFRTGSPGAEVRIPLVIPAEKQAKLFDGLPFSVQSITLVFRSGGNHDIEIVGRVNLGVGGFGSVGGTLYLRHATGGDWDTDFALDSVEGKLDLGGLRIAGGLEWKKYAGGGTFDSGRVRSANIKTAGRSLWGKLNASGLFDTHLELLLKVGTAGDTTYWAGGVLSNDPQGWRIGTATLKQPCLVVAHKADKGDLIATQLTDLTSSTFGNIFPNVTDDDDANEKAAQEWLDGWVHSARVGTMVAASAFLNVNDMAAAAPSSDRNTDRGKLTTIAFTDSGMVRASGTITCFGAYEIAVAFTHDPTLKRFMVAFQLPEFAYPSADQPQWVVSGGRMLFALGYKAGYEYFRMDIGWPELTGQDDYERDWTQSIMVKWEGFWPINTFWGGAMVEYDNGQRVFRFGIALRAGWTFDYGVSAGVAEGGVHVEIAFGGVVQLSIYFDGRQEGMPVLGAPYTRPSLGLLRAHSDDLVRVLGRSTRGRSLERRRSIPGWPTTSRS